MKNAIKKSIASLFSVLPMILAVIGLIAILQIYITPEKLSFLFGSNNITDTLGGTLQQF